MCEQVLFGMVDLGILRCDEDGKVWRDFDWDSRRREYVRCTPRRADWRGRDGYHVVRIRVKGVRHFAMAHRLVYYQFHGEPPPGAEVNHKNSLRGSNYPENLDARSAKENIAYAMEEGWLTRDENGRFRRREVIGGLAVIV